MEIQDYIKSKVLRRGNLGSIEQDGFIDVLILSLYVLKGGARRKIVLDYIEKNFGNQFREPDCELLTSQKPAMKRWVHNVDWVKQKLVENRLIHNPANSSYGTWVLTEKGEQEALNLLSK